MTTWIGRDYNKDRMPPLNNNLTSVSQKISTQRLEIIIDNKKLVISFNGNLLNKLNKHLRWKTNTISLLSLASTGQDTTDTLT